MSGAHVVSPESQAVLDALGAVKRRRDAETAQQNVLRAAACIAGSAPKKAGSYVGSALIPWTYIRDLRAALDAAGIEWQR